MFALSAASQVAQHQQARSGVKLRNRQRLSQFDAANENYEVEVMLNNNVWKNDVIVNEYEEQEVFMAMQSQWQQYDAQLDQLFAEADFKLQDSLIKMSNSIILRSGRPGTPPRCGCGWSRTTSRVRTPSTST